MGSSTVAMLVPAGLAAGLLMEGVNLAVLEILQLPLSGHTKDVDFNAEALLIGLCKCLVNWQMTARH